MRKFMLALAGAGALTAAAGSAMAATATTTFQVTATVNANCLVSATALNFGTYVPTAGDMDVNSTVSVRCTRNTPFTVALDDGTTAGGSFAQRLMTNGADTLEYNLYTATARSVVWGDDTGSTDMVGGTGAGLAVANAQTLTVYGRLFDSVTNQAAPAGSYADTITVTVTY